MSVAETAGVSVGAAPDDPNFARVLGLYTERQPCTAAGDSSCHTYLSGKLHVSAPVFYTFSWEPAGLWAMDEYKRQLLVLSIQDELNRWPDEAKLSNEAIQNIVREVDWATHSLLHGGKRVFDLQNTAMSLVEDEINKLRGAPMAPPGGGQPSTPQPAAPSIPIPIHSPAPAVPPAAPVPLIREEDRDTTTLPPGPSGPPPGRVPVKTVQFPIRATSFIQSDNPTQRPWQCRYCGQRFRDWKIPKHDAPPRLELHRAGIPVSDRKKCEGSSEYGKKAN